MKYSYRTSYYMLCVIGIMFTIGGVIYSQPAYVNDNQGSFLLAATYLGGSNFDDAYEPSIAVDGNGFVYISGFTGSHDFPTTEGAVSKEFFGGLTDRFISLFNHHLSRLEASTYIGSAGAAPGFISGNGDDLGHAIAVDGDGNVFIAGYTDSPDYPVTPNAFDMSYNGGRDLYITKLDGRLATITASTYIGGYGDEGYQWPRIDMTIDTSGDIIIAGITHSPDFPTTSGAYDRSYNGGAASGDAFVVRLDNDLSVLKASSFLGGSGNEWRVSVLVVENGDVLVCGETESADFPVTDRAYDRTFNVLKDVFISRFSSDLSVLQASTFFGGEHLEEALDIDVDDTGDIYITGYTESPDIPTTSGAYNREWSGGSRDAYIARFDADLQILRAATLFGGSEVDFSRGICWLDNGNIYVVGNTTSSDYPISDNGYQMNMKGGTSRGDVFVSVFSDDLNRLEYSTYFGGSGEDTAFCIELNIDGSIIIAGLTSSADLPTIPGSYDISYNGGLNDCFIIKIDSVSLTDR